MELAWWAVLAEAILLEQGLHCIDYGVGQSDITVCEVIILTPNVQDMFVHNGIVFEG
jgi:hypothetical protein